jgi:hypothetical protein
MQSFKILVESKAESEDGIGCIVRVEANGESEEDDPDLTMSRIEVCCFIHL